MWREQPEDQGAVIVAVAGCLKDNNFRVCQGALSVLAALVVEMGEEFRPYVGTVRLRATAQPGCLRRARQPNIAVAWLAGAPGHDRKAWRQQAARPGRCHDLH